MTKTSDLLPKLYRHLMAITRKRGMISLGKLNARLFGRGQTFHIKDTATPFIMPADPHFFGYLVGHEHHITQLVQKIVRPGDVCFDIGANIGYFANQMADRAGPQGVVHCYEIDPVNFAALEANAAMMRSAGANVILNRKAVSRQPGTLTIERGAESTLHKVRAQQLGDDAALTVPAVSIADEIAAAALDRPIRLMKVDIEGHESEAIAPLDPVLDAPGLDYLILEVFRDEVPQIAEAMERWGEKVKRLTIWDGQKWAEAPLSSIEYRTDILIAFTDEPA